MTMNLAWAKDWVKNFNVSGIDKMMSLYADDVEFEDVTFGHKETSRDGVKTFFAGFVSAIPEQSFVVRGYAGDANQGAVEWTWHAKHNEEFMGHPAKGKETQVNGVSVFRFRSGKIASQHDYWDAATPLRQIGAIK